MTRLTKSVREAMARALTKHKFDEGAKALMAESTALFEAALNERYDAATKRAMRQLSKLHPDAFATTDSLSIRVRGMRVYVGNSTIGVYNIARWQSEIAAQPVLHGDGADPSPELTDRLAQFALNLQTFNEAIKPAYRKALGTLNQFGTAKTLREGWPEAMGVIGNLLPTEDRALPVVQLEAMNDEFGLPPQEAEAA